MTDHETDLPALARSLGDAAGRILAQQMENDDLRAERDALRSIVRQVFHNIPLDAPNGAWEEYGWTDAEAAAIRAALDSTSEVDQ